MKPDLYSEISTMFSKILLPKFIVRNFILRGICTWMQSEWPQSQWAQDLQTRRIAILSTTRLEWNFLQNSNSWCHLLFIYTRKLLRSYSLNIEEKHVRVANRLLGHVENEDTLAVVTLEIFGVSTRERSRSNCITCRRRLGLGLSLYLRPSLSYLAGGGRRSLQTSFAFYTLIKR